MWQLARMHPIRSHFCSNSRYQDPGSKRLCARVDVIICVVAEYGVCENLRKLEITGVSCRDVYAKRK